MYSFQAIFKKGELELKCSNIGTTAESWLPTKEVLSFSNYYNDSWGHIKKKQKDRSKKSILFSE